MRLLHATSIELKEFSDDSTPKYAIISHRWQDGEVSYQHMQNGSATNMRGYSKLKLCCRQATKENLEYIWIDTCCIDKTNSVELSESINSMYRWYKNAIVCYVYLFDVHSMGVTNDLSFEKSVWFTRGWTLQELIAPQRVEFYNSTWDKLGTKENMKERVSVITSIDVGVLEGVDPEHFSIAKRMSWASKRTTTRAEDMAYSLLGLFGINMPMIYGEGEGAFLRLQEEIMKHSDDHSLFAWTSSSGGYRGLLAKSPTDFCDCGNIISTRSGLNRIPYFITNMGLSIELLMKAWAMDTYLAALDCEIESPKTRIGIFLKLLPEDGQCARVMIDGTDRLNFPKDLVTESHYRKIYVRQKVWKTPPDLDRMYGFWLRKFLPTVQDPQTIPHSLTEVVSWNQWTINERILKIPTGSRGTAGILWFKGERGYSFLKVGFDLMFNPVCQLGGSLWMPFQDLHNSYSPVQGPLEVKMDAKWMDRQSYYVLKRTGSEFAMNPYWSPLRQNEFGYKEKEFVSQPKLEWVNEGTEYVFEGNRVSGLSLEKGRGRVSIKDEVINNRRLWVIDIEQPTDARHKGVICDGCKFEIYGRRFECNICKDFDYCMECFLTAKDTHPPHDFKALDLRCSC
ncbi:heterokaryon incompatibility protein-domain-containing protein [Tricladium varicosporioides]|nr:heterokaryon incompatibility protein-domain-containing protein [Hymenoscyphus varicosporioides]